MAGGERQILLHLNLVISHLWQANWSDVWHCFETGSFQEEDGKVVLVGAHFKVRVAFDHNNLKLLIINSLFNQMQTAWIPGMATSPSRFVCSTHHILQSDQQPCDKGDDGNNASFEWLTLYWQRSVQLWEWCRSRLEKHRTGRSSEEPYPELQFWFKRALGVE